VENTTDEIEIAFDRAATVDGKTIDSQRNLTKQIQNAHLKRMATFYVYQASRDGNLKVHFERHTLELLDQHQHRSQSS
jgi:hypothetical protein